MGHYLAFGSVMIVIWLHLAPLQVHVRRARLTSLVRLPSRNAYKALKCGYFVFDRRIKPMTRGAAHVGGQS